jgi:hypothetical protein
LAALIIGCTHQQGVAVAGVEQCWVLHNIEGLYHLQEYTKRQRPSGTEQQQRGTFMELGVQFLVDSTPS